MVELALLSALVMNGMDILLGKLAEKLFHLDLVEKASVMYPNAGNLVLPLVTGVFGGEWVMYVTVYSMVQTTLVWTHARMMMSGVKKISLRDVVCNVNILAISLGCLMFLFRIQLPGIVQDAFSMAGNTVGPMAMLITGMVMADIDLKRLKAYRRIWKPVLLRLVILPVLLVCLAKFTNMAALAPHGKTLMIISLLSTIAPAANIVTQFSQMFNRDALYASLINTVTMLLCIVTMPLLIAFYQM